MAFNINAQVILSGPKNIKTVTNKIQKQLGGITATVNLKVAKGTSRNVAALNRHVAALNKNLATLQGAATGANTALASLGTSLKAVNTGGSRFVQTQNKVNNSLKQTNSQLKDASYSMDEFGKESARAIRRFGAFTVATGTVFGFIRAVQSATKEALIFERELVKLEQITGRGGKALNDIRKTVDDLSKSLGIDANELLKVGKTFAQTGQTLDQVKRSMEAVARSSLAPTFGTMASTTEGLIAAMAQFNIKAGDSEKVLGSLNAVSKKFAVESSDLISAVRRAGGVFAATSNQVKEPIQSLNELIAIFTAVRSTTRETADTIATGLRTIFSRIQRPRTIEFLKQFGIELLDLKGNFKGTFESFQELSNGLKTIIAQGDVLKLAQITEELGGIRQVGKLIPAIKNFDKSLQALEVASKGAADGLGNDVRLALQPLGKQFERVAAQFNTLVRDVSQSHSFQQFARVALETASALISVADALRPLIPMITTLASIRIARGAFGFAQGFVSEFRGGGGAAGVGGRLGGAVTGGGGGAQQIAAQHSSTRAINALSSSLKANSVKLGTNNTALGNVHTSLRVLTGRVNDLIIALRTSGGGRGGTGFVPIGGGGPRGSGPRGGNPSGSRGRRPGRARGFAAGGRVGNTLANNLTSGALQKKVYRGDLDDKLLSGRAFNAEDRFSNKLNHRSYPSRIPKGYTGTGRQLSPTQFERYVAWRQYQFEKRGSGLRSLAKSKTAPIDIPSTGTEVKRIGSIGNIGDAAMRDKVIRALKGPGKQLDFQGLGQLKKNWKVRSGNQKWTAGADQISIPDIEIAYANSNRISRTAAGRIGLTRKAKGLRSGGNVFQPQGTDTVPAMLTPGEFVINRQSAERIGYGNLSDMNRLAKGGVARSSKTQYFANGTTGSGGLGHPGSMPGVTKATAQVNKNLGVMSSRMATVTSNLVGLGFALTTLDFTSFKGVMDSFRDMLPTIALTVGPSLISGLTQLGTQGAKAGAALGTIGKGLGVAGLVSLVADPVAQSITNSIFGTLQERTTRRSGTLTAYEDAATTGATQGALSGAAKGAGAGFLVGSIIGPPGQLAGAIAGGIIGAVEGVFSGSALEIAAQRQADSLRRLTTESRALEKIFKELAEEGPDLGRGGEAKAREGFADAHRMRQRIQEDLGTVRHEQRSAGLLDDIAAFAETFFDFTKLFSSPFESMAQIKSKEEYMENRGGRLKAFEDMLKTDAIKGTVERGRAVMEQGAGAQTSAALRQTTNIPATTVTNLGELEFHIGELLNEAKNAVTEDDKGIAMIRVNALSQHLERLSQQGAPVTGGQVTEAMELSTIKDVAIRQQRADSIKQERVQYVQLQFATLQVQENLQTLKLAFETFGKALDQEMQKLNTSMQEGASSISDLSSSVIQMRNMPFADVVNNLETSSLLDIAKSVEGVQNISGGSTAFEGVQNLLLTKQEMPDILRSVVQTVATQTRQQNARAATGDAGFISQGKFISDALVEELGTRGLKIPEEVSQAIQVGLTESFARQGIKGSPVEILQAEGANITQKAFESQDAILEAFGKVSQALNDYKSKLLDIGNLQSKLVRDQINNELQINRKRFDIEDRVNRVRGRSTRPGTARDRLMTQMSTVLGRDARGPDLAGRLAKERIKLEEDRRGLRDDFRDTSTRTDQKKAEAALRKNTDAINRNKQATEMLANDVTVLAELEQRAARATRQELGAQAGILGFSEATDKLLSGTREGFEAFANFTAPINALIKASHNQMLRPDEARGLIQGIQSGDPILSTFLDNLPGGENQAKELKQNLVRNLAQDTAMKLSMVGGAPGTYAELLPMLEKAYTAALDRKTGIAGEMEAIGREQNRLLTNSMKAVTNAALDVFAGMIIELDRTFDSITQHIITAGTRRGNVPNVSSLPNINAALQTFDELLGVVRGLTAPIPQRMSDTVPPARWGGSPNIMEYAQGGYVSGPSHGSGGVMANLEGGEYVVPKKYAQGGVAYLQGGGGPSFSNFWENFKYQFGFGSPETIKKHQEASRGTYGGSNIPAAGIGGGPGMMTGMGTVKGWLKHVLPRRTKANIGRGGSFSRIGGAVAMAADTREKSSNYWENRRPGHEVVQEAIESGAHTIQSGKKVAGRVAGNVLRGQGRGPNHWENRTPGSEVVQGAIESGAHAIQSGITSAKQIGPAIGTSIKNLGDYLGGRRALGSMDIHKQLSEGLSSGPFDLGFTDLYSSSTPTLSDASKAAAAASQAGVQTQLQQKTDQMREGRGFLATAFKDYFGWTGIGPPKGRAKRTMGRDRVPPAGPAALLPFGGPIGGGDIAKQAGAGFQEAFSGGKESVIWSREMDMREKKAKEEELARVKAYSDKQIKDNKLAKEAEAARHQRVLADTKMQAGNVKTKANADIQARITKLREQGISPNRISDRGYILPEARPESPPQPPVDRRSTVGSISGTPEDSKPFYIQKEDEHGNVVLIPQTIKTRVMPWEERDRERREKTKAATKASEERMTKPVTGYWADQLAKPKAKQEEAETAANIAAERDAAIKEQKRRIATRRKDRLSGLRYESVATDQLPGRAAVNRRAAARRQERQRRLGLIPQAATPARGGGGIFGRIGQAIGNLFGSGRGRAGGGRGRGPAIPTPRGLTDKQKEDRQAERRARRKKRRQSTLDSMEKQRKRRAAAERPPEPLLTVKRGTVSSEERVQRAGPMTGGSRVRRRGERSKPKTAAQLDREERESVAQSHRTQSATHTAQTKAMQDQRNAAMDARRREEEALTNEILAKKGRDSTGRRKDQKTVPEIRAANVEKINERILTYQEVIAKQKAKGQDTRSAEGSLVKLHEELLALQKIDTQDKAHAAHLDQVGARQTSAGARPRLIQNGVDVLPGREREGVGRGVLRDPAFADPAPATPKAAPAPTAPAMTQQQANERFLKIQTFPGSESGYQAPKPTSHAEKQAAQQRGDFSMFTEDKPKLGKESDVFGFGDSEREKRMRARVQSEGDWRVGHRESMAGVRAEGKERQIDKFRRARGYALGGSIFKPKGTDTVPAMLTPGEFVINRESAQAIGNDKLNAMNKRPPQGMANGGTVPSPQYLQGGGGVTEGADVAAKLAESQASMNKLSEALGKIPEVINIELKQNGIVKVALDEQFVPQVKKYFEQWANEKLNGAGRADDSNVDTSMHNRDYGGG